MFKILQILIFSQLMCACFQRASRSPEGVEGDSRLSTSGLSRPIDLEDHTPTTYSIHAEMTPLRFNNTGADAVGCSVDQELPKGLNLSANMGTCEITGTPILPTEMKTYVITGTSSDSSYDSASVDITIVAIPVLNYMSNLGLHSFNGSGTKDDPYLLEVKEYSSATITLEIGGEEDNRLQLGCINLPDWIVPDNMNTELKILAYNSEAESWKFGCLAYDGAAESELLYFSVTIVNSTEELGACHIAEGIRYSGSCWLLGDSGLSCDAACGEHTSFTYNASTATYAGSSGSNANCSGMLDLLGILPGASVTDFSIGGHGCFVAGGNRYRDTSLTTSTQATAGYQRVCACNFPNSKAVFSYMENSELASFDQRLGTLAEPHRFSVLATTTNGTLSFDMFDPDEDMPTIACTSLPSWASIDLGQNRLSFSPLIGDVGSNISFNCYADDGMGPSTAIYFNLEVLGLVSSPVAGNKGIISVSNLTDKSVDLDWRRATDNLDAQSSLEYRLYQSLDANIATVSEVEAVGIPLTNYTSDLTSYTVSSLSPSERYFFNVIVKDSAGNKSAYMMQGVMVPQVTGFIYVNEPDGNSEECIAGTLETQDTYGYQVPVHSATDLVLTSSSSGGGFYSDPYCVNKIDNSTVYVNIPSGSFGTTFYYKDTSAGGTLIDLTVDTKDDLGWLALTNSFTLGTRQEPYSWTTPVQLSAYLATAYEYDVSMNDQGKAMILWNQSGSGCCTPDNIIANYFDGTSMGSDITIDTSSSDVWRPSLAFNSSSEALAFYNDWGDPTSNVFDGTTWVSESVFSLAQSPLLTGLAKTGLGMVVGITIGGDLQAATWNGSVWSGLSTIDAGTADTVGAGDVSIATNNHSSTTAIIVGWIEDDTVYTSIWNGVSWTTPASMESSGDAVLTSKTFTPQVAISPDGTKAAITWMQFTPTDGAGRYNVYANYYDGTSWQGRQRVSDLGQTLYKFKSNIALNNAGEANLAWWNDAVSSTHDLQTSYFDGTTWSAPETLLADGSYGQDPYRPSRPEIVMLSNGTGQILWREHSTIGGGDGTIMTAYFYGRVNGWAPPFELDTMVSLSEWEEPKLGVDQTTGKAIAVWRKSGVITYSLYE